MCLSILLAQGGKLYILALDGIQGADSGLLDPRG